MPAKRKPLLKQNRGKFWSTLFRHPLTKRVVRVNLGTLSQHDEAEARLHALNAVFTDPTRWHQPNFPEGCEDLAAVWNEDLRGAAVRGKTVRSGGHQVDAPTRGIVAAHLATIDALREENMLLKAEARKYRKLYESTSGRKARVGASPSLRRALDDWKSAYQGKDPDHTKIVGYDLERFIDHFGANTLVDDLDGAEGKINTWLNGLQVSRRQGEKEISRPISAGRRAQIRRHVLRFLEDSGLQMNRKTVRTVSRKEIRRDRGAIRWLTRDQVVSIASLLQRPWLDVFDLQCTIGLRPSEVPTLKASDLSSDMNRLTLSPIGELTLKTGSREITIANFPKALTVIKQLAADAADDVLFLNNKQPWVLKNFMRQYKEALSFAATEAGIKMKMDARVPRRTCASLLIREGVSVESVATLLGDDPATIREHYGRLQSHEVGETFSRLQNVS
jgi:site-specific recombinase XerD